MWKVIIKWLFVAKLDTSFRHKRKKAFLEQIFKQDRYFDTDEKSGNNSKLFVD